MATTEDLEQSNELFTRAEFEAVMRHKGGPAVRIDPLRLGLVLVMAVLGAGILIAGIAMIFWPAALLLGGVALLGGAYLIDVSASAPVEDDRG